MRHRMGLRPIVLAIALVASLFAGIAPAQALDERVPDGRQTNYTSEIAAQYWHDLGRDPDPGWSVYTNMAAENCRRGVNNAAYSIANSGEAAARWRNSNDRAGMLFAGLLNRPPSSNDVAAYSRHIRLRGLGWTTMNIMSSLEYGYRVERICATTRVTTPSTSYAFARVMGPGEAHEFAATMAHYALNLGTVCAFSQATKAALSRIGKKPITIPTAAAKIVSVLSKKRTKQLCAAALEYAKVAFEIDRLDDHGAVWVDLWVGNKGVSPNNYDLQRFAYRIGPSPAQFKTYSGRA